MMRKYFLFLLLTVCSLGAYAQKSYNEQVQAYIEQFKDLAVAEQQRTGVPASIKLAQGIYETGAGSSELCNNARNHFGIKCKNTWAGETYTYTDDAKDECFRKYSTAQSSYKDHSDFLKNNKRYSSLFDLSPTDYAAWAHGLKRCGYATNPQYAKKIIKTIEDFRLQEYTYAALGNKNEGAILASAAAPKLPRTKTVAAILPGEHVPTNDAYTGETTSVADEGSGEIVVMKSNQQEQETGNGIKDYYQNTTKNGLKGFYARKGDMLLEYAIKNRIRYAKILEWNDLPDKPLEADMFIYLERKLKIGNKDNHTVASGETLLQISQEEGMQLQQLRSFNLLEKEEEPVAGTVLNLRVAATEKPSLYPTRTKRKSEEVGNTYVVADKKDAYIATTRSNVTQPVARNDDAGNGDNDGNFVETTPATARKNKVNIAAEQPVEEAIAEERAKNKSADASKMTPLEKLKAHMDKTVYAADRKFEPKTSKQYDEEAVATVPARAELPAKTVNPAPSKKTQPIAKAKQQKEKVHTVRKGETLFGIADKYNIPVAKLQKINKLGSGKKIQPGMKLKVTTL